MAAPTIGGVTAADVRALLAVRYPAPEWRVESEVTLNTRRLDVVVFRLWGGSGKGYRVLGFEIKVARADWLRELASIDKSAEWSSVVDTFYVVAVPGVVKLEELPKGWGLLEVSKTGTQLRLKAHAAVDAPGATLPRELVARLLERDNAARGRERRVELDAAQREAVEQARQVVAAEMNRLREEAAKLQALREQAGLHRYADPVLALRTAHRVQVAVDHLPDSSTFEWAGRRVLELAEQTAKHVQELNDASVVFRQLARTADAPAAPSEPARA